MIVSELNGRRLPRKSQGAEMSAVSEHIRSLHDVPLGY